MTTNFEQLLNGYDITKLKNLVCTKWEHGASQGIKGDDAFCELSTIILNGGQKEGDIF